jgi:AcrR family transcriptional regulator
MLSTEVVPGERAQAGSRVLRAVGVTLIRRAGAGGCHTGRRQISYGVAMAERRTRANGRASRSAILAAAAEVFAERGYRGTSLTEIANRVSMTQPGLLHHFSTKDLLLLAVVEAHEQGSEHDAMLADLAPGHFRLADSVEKLAVRNAGARQAQLLLTTLSAEAIPRDHPLHEHFVQRYRRFRKDLAGILRTAQEDGVVRRDVQPRELAREIIATLDGLHLQWLLDPGEINLKRALRAYAVRLERDMAPPAAERDPAASA